jgi:hypothetical protein
MITTPDGRPDKYAQIERERRFLLAGLPAALEGRVDYHLIVDRYLPETMLRLRRIEMADGTPVSYKLARKWRLPALPPEATAITNLYLTAAEYELLARLPGATLRKRRYPLVHEGVRFSIDQFEGALAGLVLAELHLFPGLDALAPCPLPGCLREVTAEPAFSGGRLVQLRAEEAGQWLDNLLAR